jgi:gamma-glutamyltranspeptidase
MLTDCLHQWFAFAANGLNLLPGLQKMKDHLLAACAQVLQPAIELAEQGFPVSPVTAYHWDISAPQLRGPGKISLLNPEGRAPRAGEIQRNPDLATTFRTLAEHGALEGT